MVLLAYTVAGVKDNHVATMRETIEFNGLYAQEYQRVTNSHKATSDGLLCRRGSVILAWVYMEISC